ncbi:MAG: NADPH dehydrogenase NamA [Athalassotoga sp.]|uniref:NADPH dehydrogenase NamA n=1 Tax=Athalassotoga sp. TaxID=2022597 RepID=UPI003CFD5F47
MLFEKIKIGDLELKNRIVMPAMCQYSSDETGMVKSWHLSHYQTRAVGGTGLIVIEATAVDPDGRISRNDLGIWEDRQIEGLKKLVDLVHDSGSKIAIQLAHAGRKSKATENPIAPSAIRYSENYSHPREMKKSEIKEMIDKFSLAAKRADLAGFDGIEIHAAHGYLINEFLSPLTNKRADEYGGNIENRTRFLSEIVDGMRKNWHKPLWIRVSASDYAKGGNEVEDIIEALKILGDRIDGVNVSGGGVIHEQHIKVYPGYMLEDAKKIRSATHLTTIGGGLINSYELAEFALNTHCNLVFIGRQLLRDPYWPLKCAKEAGIDLEWPFQYERAKIY